MNQKTHKRLQPNQSGFSLMKLLVLVGVVIVVAIIVAVVYNVLNRTNSEGTPPVEPIDSSRRVIQKEPRATGPGQSENTAPAR